MPVKCAPPTPVLTEGNIAHPRAVSFLDFKPLATRQRDQCTPSPDLAVPDGSSYRAQLRVRNVSSVCVTFKVSGSRPA